MKIKLLFLSFLMMTFGAGNVLGQTTANDLVGLCTMDGNCATYIADNVAGGAKLNNNSSLQSRNQANDGDLNLIKADTSDNTALTSSTADILITVSGTGDDIIATAVDDIVLQGGGAADIVTIAGGGTTVDLTVADNLITVASGTALTLTSGDLTITAGDIAVPAAANLGFIGEEGGNTACDTTCTLGCVIGYDDGTSVFVACTSALADVCICAGS